MKLLRLAADPETRSGSFSAACARSRPDSAHRRGRALAWQIAVAVATLGCGAAGPAPDAAPWRMGLRTGLGSSSSLQLSGGYYVEPVIAVGAMVRSRALLGAALANATGAAFGAEEIDVSLLEVGGHTRIAPITSGSTRPFIDCIAGWSHADSTRSSAAASGLLLGVEVGFSSYVGEFTALDFGVAYARVDLDRGFGIEEDVEILLGVTFRF